MNLTAAQPRIFDLPFPPSVNHAVRQGRGRRYRSPEYKRFREAAGRAALAQGIRPFDGAVDVTVSLLMPATAGDTDGRVKCLLDALNGIAWNDDKQVRDITLRRRTGERRCVVIIHPVTAEAQ